jgi:hypothetical protein
MFRKSCVFAGLALAAVIAAGCARSAKERTIEVKAANDPLFQARSVLERYAQGQPPSSEVTSFPKMVEDVRKVDPARAVILELGLAEIQKAWPSARPAKARELLQKLRPSMS